MEIVLKYRIPILFVLILGTIALGIFMKDLERDASIRAMFPQDNPHYLYFTEIEELFGSVSQIIVGIRTEDTVYTKKTLNLTRELTDFFENLDEIDEDDVISITNVNDIQGREGELIVEPLVEEDEVFDTASLAAIRKQVRSNPMLLGKLISEDEKSILVMAALAGEELMEENVLQDLIARVQDKLDELQKKNPHIEFYLTGMPVGINKITEYMNRDLAILSPIAVLVVIIMLYVLLRKISGVIAPILVTLFAVVWTFGLKGLVSSAITISETAIPVMLIAIGCADGVHIISEFFKQRTKSQDTKQAVLETMRILNIPVILTSVTTSLGFASLITAPGISIRNIGIFLGFGVMVAMMFSLLFIPSFLSFFKAKKFKKAAAPALKQTDYFDTFLQWMGSIIIKYRLLIVCFALGLFVLSIIGIFNISVESDEMQYFKPDNPIRIATKNVQDSLGGIVSLDIIMEAGETDAIKRPTVLKAMWDLQKFCEKQELVSYTLSLADNIKRMNYVIHDSDTAYDRLPGEVEIVGGEEIPGINQVAQLLLLYEWGGGAEMDKLVNSDYSRARINIRLRDTSNKKMEALIKKIDNYVTENMPEDITIKYTNHYVRYIMQNLIVQSQVNSLIMVLVTILILLTIIFRSPVAGIFTATPVFIAILFNFAVMWLTGVTLNIGTSIIASVGMGVGIDYAIHYFSRFKAAFKQIPDHEKAVVLAVRGTGRAIISNALAVGTGFLVLLLSEYHIIVNVGWITALSMLTTAVSSLVVLPALIIIFKPGFIKSEKK